MTENKDKIPPCIKEKCSLWCDPVKLPRFFPREKIPKNDSGEKIWEFKGLIVDPRIPDGPKIEAFRCKNHDTKTGLCRDYANRPDICRNTTCQKEGVSEEGARKIRDTIKEMSYITIKRK